MISPVHRPSQDKLLAFLCASIDSGRQPSGEEMRRHMGWAAITSVGDCLRKLWRDKRLPAKFNFALAMAQCRAAKKHRPVPSLPVFPCLEDVDG